MRYRIEIFGNQIKATKESNFYKWTKLENYRPSCSTSLLREPRPVIILIFLEHFGLSDGVFSAEEKGSFKIGKLDDSR